VFPRLRLCRAKRPDGSQKDKYKASLKAGHNNSVTMVNPPNEAKSRALHKQGTA
jgi:hypothetical protein